ncbi:Enoyl-CoA hydratase [Rhodococcus sp. WAY2]|nr:Enoyl-CoA hydratase [Rhodococcus sp. WAY2]
MFWTSIGDGKEGVAAFLSRNANPTSTGAPPRCRSSTNDWIAHQP